MGSRRSRGNGWQRGKNRPELFGIGTLFQGQVEVLFGQVEHGQTMLVHQFDDFTDFLEVHGG